MTPLRKRQARKERDLLNETRVQRQRVKALEKALKEAIDHVEMLANAEAWIASEAYRGDPLAKRWRRVLEAT